MALTKSEVKDKIKLKQVGGIWGISIPSDFVSAKVELKISRKDKYSKCKQALEDSVKFDTNSSGELGIRIEKAGDMDPDHKNQIKLKTVYDDQYDDNGVALVDFHIGNVETNYSEANASEHTEEDELNVNKNNTFYKFDKLEGRTDGGNTIDYQKYLKNGSTSNWDDRQIPEISNGKQRLDFHDNEGGDNNAEMNIVNRDLEFNEKPSLKKIKVQKRDGTYISQDISDDTSTTIKIKVKPNSATGTFYQIDLTIGSGETPNLTSSDRDGVDFYESKKAIFIRDNCNDDNDDGTDYKNTLIFIKSISEIVLTGPDTNEDDDEPVVEEEVDDPDPEPEPPDPTVLTETAGPGSCPRRNETPWTLPWGGTWEPNYIPTCAPEPVTVDSPGGGLSLTRDPNNKKRVVLSFSDISGTETGKELREQLNLKNSTPNRSLANKLITLKVTYSKTAGWANSLVMTASCSDIKKPNTTLETGGAPYSRPNVSENHAQGDPNVTNQVYYFYNVDGSSTVDFVFDTSNTDEPSRCYFTGESVVTTGPVTGTDENGDPTLTYTETRTCLPESGCITETYSQFYQWPPCPVEAYVTKTGGTTVSAVFSDGHWDGANDQTITIEWVAMRESAIDIWANDSLNLQEAPFGIAEKLRKFVWVTSSTADNDDNLGAVDGLSLIDYHEHSDKIRFRNPVTRTSAINLADDGTSILELEGHSGALFPGTIDTKISNAVAAGASLPINLSYY